MTQKNFFLCFGVWRPTLDSRPFWVIVQVLRIDLCDFVLFYGWSQMIDNMSRLVLKPMRRKIIWRLNSCLDHFLLWSEHLVVWALFLLITPRLLLDTVKRTLCEAFFAVLLRYLERRNFFQRRFHRFWNLFQDRFQRFDFSTVWFVRDRQLITNIFLIDSLLYCSWPRQLLSHLV